MFNIPQLSSSIGSCYHHMDSLMSITDIDTNSTVLH